MIMYTSTTAYCWCDFHWNGRLIISSILMTNLEIRRSRDAAVALAMQPVISLKLTSLSRCSDDLPIDVATTRDDGLERRSQATARGMVKPMAIRTRGPGRTGHRNLHTDPVKEATKIPWLERAIASLMQRRCHQFGKGCPDKLCYASCM